MGQQLGVLFTYNLFLPCSSLDWLNKNIFISNPLSSTPFTYENSLYFIAIFYVVTLIWIMIFISEKDPNYNEADDTFYNDDENSNVSIKKVFLSFPRFFTNRDTRRIIFFFMIKYLGINAIGAVYGMELTGHGFPNSQTAIISTLNIPVIFLVCFLGGTYLKRGQNQRMCQYTFIFY